MYCAVNQSGDANSMDVWSDIERVVEELIKEHSDYRPHQSTQKLNLNLHKIYNENKRKNVEKCHFWLIH